MLHAHTRPSPLTTPTRGADVPSRIAPPSHVPIEVSLEVLRTLVEANFPCRLACFYFPSSPPKRSASAHGAFWEVGTAIKVHYVVLRFFSPPVHPTVPTRNPSPPSHSGAFPGGDPWTWVPPQRSARPVVQGPGATPGDRKLQVWMGDGPLGRAAGALVGAPRQAFHCAAGTPCQFNQAPGQPGLA
jgi:hypothetical protein